MNRFYKSLDKVLTVIEDKGYIAANKLHMYGVNIILAGCGYTLYTVVRDYNETFKEERKITNKTIN